MIDKFENDRIDCPFCKIPKSSHLIRSKYENFNSFEKSYIVAKYKCFICGYTDTLYLSSCNFELVCREDGYYDIRRNNE